MHRIYYIKVYRSIFIHFIRINKWKKGWKRYIKQCAALNLHYFCYFREICLLCLRDSLSRVKKICLGLMKSGSFAWNSKQIYMFPQEKNPLLYKFAGPSPHVSCLIYSHFLHRIILISSDNFSGPYLYGLFFFFIFMLLLAFLNLFFTFFL